MKYDHFTMLPEQAFQKVGYKLNSLEGGGGKSAPPPPAPVIQQVPEAKPLETAKGSTTQNDQIAMDAKRQGTKELRIDLGGSGGDASGLNIPD